MICNIVLYINEKNARLLRGGAFMLSTGERPLGVPWQGRPSSHNIDIGFRLARTYH